MSKARKVRRRNPMARVMAETSFYRSRVVRNVKGKGAYSRKGRVPQGTAPSSFSGVHVLRVSA